MKTAVSLPDDLYELAEAKAKRLRVSRSKLYATAIAEFLERSKSNDITDQLNRVYRNVSSKLDPALHRSQRRSLSKNSW